MSLLNISRRETAALDRLLHAYLLTEEGDPGMPGLKTLQAKIWQLEQDHTAYDEAFQSALPTNPSETDHGRP